MISVSINQSKHIYTAPQVMTYGRHLRTINFTPDLYQAEVVCVCTHSHIFVTWAFSLRLHGKYYKYQFTSPRITAWKDSPSQWL